MPSPSHGNVLILGASARAAAFSAIRAGLRPRCVDYFADADLAAVCPTTAIDPRQPDAEIERLAVSPGRPRWFYTGPFENRPDLVARLSLKSRLLGNGAETLRAVRDPWRAASVVHRADMAAPGLARIADGPPAPGRWLVKPLASAGGVGVRFWDGTPPAIDASHYLQEYIDGPTLSALYVAARGAARLLGIVRQEQGAPGAPFLYRGSVGPWPVGRPVAAKLDRLGELLAVEFALVGLFGVDFVLADGEPRPIEINPRYTASVEVLELAARRSLLADHLRACVRGDLPEAYSSPPSSSDVVGKRVLYASRPIRVPEIPIPRILLHGFQVPPIADIPRPGVVIQPGEPIMTVLARGRDPEACLSALDRLERAWRERLAARAENAPDSVV